MELLFYPSTNPIPSLQLEAVGKRLSDLVQDHLTTAKNDIGQDVIEGYDVKLT